MFTWFEYGIVAVYMLAILAIGAWFSRKGSENVEAYFLGGKTLPWWVLGISFMTSNLDLTGTMVIASFFAMAGLKGFLVELRGGTALPLALFMIFMAKWHRRAAVMTVAEWMEFRFGDQKGARAARFVSAISVILMVIGMMTYFVVGFGKFLSVYFPFSPMLCAIVFTGLACIHILASGLYGVAFTDVLQGAMILFTVLYVTVLAFTADIDTAKLQEAWGILGAESMTWEQWTSITPSWTMSWPEGYELYNAFGFLLIFYVIRIFLEGFGGPLIPYATQRFFAARNDREASLTTGSSLLLFTVRWPLIIGVAVLGLSLGSGVPTDPEMVFPAVLREYFPVGLRAVVVSCMIAAAMSTFDSTVNAGGAYIVNDVYRRFINPDASNKRLMRVSMASTVALTLVCLVLASRVQSINEIWSWISMAFFGGVAVPMVLRWYWERLNGWGYTVGTVVGMVAAVLLPVMPEWMQAEWIALAVVGLLALVGTIIGSLMTEPTAESTVVEFYRRTRPLGRWPRARAGLGAEDLAAIDAENRNDLISVPPAVLFFYFLFLAPMYAIVKDYRTMLLVLVAVAVCATVLYFTWYRNLEAGETEPEPEDDSEPPDLVA